MTGLFGSLNTATSGLRAQQTALQTTSHNLSNANTDGYSRQRVTMEASMPQSFTGIGQVGTGVQIAGVTRIVDTYVTTQLQNENASLSRYEQTSDVIGQLETIYNELSETGLANQMSEVFVSWSNLAANPELKTAKTMVVRQSETFLDSMNHMANKMEDLSTDTVREIEQDVLDFNSTAEQLSGLNKQIFNATVKGQTPNDLLDQQERLLGKMSSLAGIDVKKDGFGRAFVSLGEQEIVTENEVNKLSSDSKGQITVGDQAVELETGSMKGLQEALTVVEEKREELNTFAFNLAKAVNTIHTDEGKSDRAFFVFDTKENAAQTLSVNQSLRDDPTQLHAGKALDNSVAGDGSRAKAIADLQHTSLGPSEWTYDSATMSFENQADGSPLFNHYNEMVTDMGIVKQQADNMVANQSDLVSLLEQRRESMSGVDINEEVVDMIRYQSAYQANARVISVTSEMLDTLINRTGV